MKQFTIDYDNSITFSLAEMSENGDEVLQACDALEVNASFTYNAGAGGTFIITRVS